MAGRGYFARSSGKASLDTVRTYVDSQVEHPGYRGTWTEELRVRNPDFKSPAFPSEHSNSILKYHLVLVTEARADLFDGDNAQELFQYCRHRI